MENKILRSQLNNILSSRNFVRDQYNRLEELDASLRPQPVWLEGLRTQQRFFGVNGGMDQQDRMIFDKKRTLDRAMLYSYQAAKIKRVGSEEESPISRCLINPDKTKQDYDDKILSIPYEDNYTTGDIFEWIGTGTYWLIYLQSINELAYFRGEIRRCRYEITWEDANGELHTTKAAVRGPVETKINYIQKHTTSVDTPNHSLRLLLPLKPETQSFFKRYAKFFLQGQPDEASMTCWRVEAVDSISTPNILELEAVEYYTNLSEDDTYKKVVGLLKPKKEELNSEEVNSAIVGPNFIKPRITTTYTFEGRAPLETEWSWSKEAPIRVTIEDRTAKVYWDCNYSGQFDLTYGDITKTIVVETLF